MENENKSNESTSANSAEDRNLRDTITIESHKHLYYLKDLKSDFYIVYNSNTGNKHYIKHGYQSMLYFLGAIITEFYS